MRYVVTVLMTCTCKTKPCKWICRPYAASKVTGQGFIFKFFISILSFCCMNVKTISYFLFYTYIKCKGYSIIVHNLSEIYKKLSYQISNIKLRLNKIRDIDNNICFQYYELTAHFTLSLRITISLERGICGDF